MAMKRLVSDFIGLKVFVYFNLHKKCFSVRALEGEHKGSVISHADVVYLRDAEPKVSQAGRERVIREKQKNVHAGIVGILTLPQDFEGDSKRGLTYNPYVYKTFVYVDSKEDFKKSDWCKMNSIGRVSVLVD